MEIRIVALSVVVSDDAREHLERRLFFALSRFGDEVSRVTVEVSGKEDAGRERSTRFRIETRVSSVGILITEDSDPDPYTAIDRATERTGRAVGRALALLRELRRSDSHHSKQ